jgi:alanine dehydrogenase
MIKSMKKGSVFVDISIDQGGCGETIKPTNLDAPTFIEEGVIHYGVCNMPAQTPRTSTQALTAATLPYIVKIANNGGIAALNKFADLRGALNTHHGMLTNHEVSEATGFRFTAIDEALKA